MQFKLSTLKKLNFPPYQLTVKKEDDVLFVFDEIRKKWLQLTPEEWVRQHAIFYLVDQKKFPPGLIGVEKTIQVNGLNKRFDVVCFDQNGAPLMLVECKAPEVAITQETLDQALRYNSQLQVKYLLLTNGITHVIAFIDYEKKQMDYLDDIPKFADIV